MHVSGETSSLSAQRFNRGAVITVIITVLNWVTELEHQLTHYTERKRPQWLQNLVQKDSLGLENSYPESQFTTVQLLQVPVLAS